jgi:histidinol-phosphate aminotransferase
MNAHPKIDLATLRHHGDVEIAAGLADFAVNVRSRTPPSWLVERLTTVLGELGAYPTRAADAHAREVVAARHGRSPAEVLLLSGAAEGFALLPHLRPTLAAIVHPGFTEPEVALRTAGCSVRHVVLSASDGYALHSELVPQEADLVVIGNPTNPTGVLHSREEIRRLARPGRVVVVDEAFLDAVPGEPESLANKSIPGILVLRSLTKTWALAGLRAGYALAEPELLATLARHRPQWPVNSLALEAIAACSAPDAVAQAEAEAEKISLYRKDFAQQLREIEGIDVHEGAAPFLLLAMPHGDKVRLLLREHGFAVRRADTFPGLTTDHIRVAVREPEQYAPLVAALREVLEL